MAMVVKTRGRRWRDDQRGAILIQSLLILPLFILVAFGGFEVWKILSIRHSLHAATYQATRYLSLNPVGCCPGLQVWESTAWQMVCHEMQSNPFAVPPGRDICRTDQPPGDLVAELKVESPSGQNLGMECGQRFTLIVRWRTSVRVPYLNRSLVLSEEHEGLITC